MANSRSTNWESEMLVAARAIASELSAIRGLLERLGLPGKAGQRKRLRRDDLTALELLLPAIRSHFGESRFGAASVVDALASRKGLERDFAKLGALRLGKLLARAAEAPPVGRFSVRQAGQDAAGNLWSVDLLSSRADWGQLDNANSSPIERQHPPKGKITP